MCVTGGQLIATAKLLIASTVAIADDLMGRWPLGLAKLSISIPAAAFNSLNSLTRSKQLANVIAKEVAARPRNRGARVNTPTPPLNCSTSHSTMPDKDDVNQPLLKDEASADLDREALVPPRQPRRLLRWLAGAIVAFVVIEAAVVNHVRPDSASLAGNLNTCAPPDAVSIKAPRTSESQHSCGIV